MAETGIKICICRKNPMAAKQIERLIVPPGDAFFAWPSLMTELGDRGCYKRINIPSFRRQHVRAPMFMNSTPQLGREKI